MVRSDKLTAEEVKQNPPEHTENTEPEEETQLLQQRHKQVILVQVVLMLEKAQALLQKLLQH